MVAFSCAAWLSMAITVIAAPSSLRGVVFNQETPSDAPSRKLDNLFISDGGVLRFWNDRFGSMACLDHGPNINHVGAYPCDEHGGNQWTVECPGDMASGYGCERMRLINNRYGEKLCLDHHAPHEVDAYPCTDHGGDVWDFEIVGDADAESGGRIRLFNSRFGEKDCLDHHGQDGTVAMYPCDDNGGDDWTYSIYSNNGLLRGGFNSTEEHANVNSTLEAAKGQAVSANALADAKQMTGCVRWEDVPNYQPHRSNRQNCEGGGYKYVYNQNRGQPNAACGESAQCFCCIQNWKIFSGYACHWPYEPISTSWECNEAAKHVQSNHLAVNMNVPSAAQNPYGCYIYGNAVGGYSALYYNFHGTTSGSWSNRNVICKEGSCKKLGDYCGGPGQRTLECCGSMTCKRPSQHSNDMRCAW